MSNYTAKCLALVMQEMMPETMFSWVLGATAAWWELPWQMKAGRSRHGQQQLGRCGPRVQSAALTAWPESTWKQTGGADVRLRRPQDEGLGEVRWLTAIVPCRQQFVRTHNRNWILSVTFNQWSSRRSGVVCSEREERYKRAAAFKTDCSRCKLTVHWKFQLV